MNERLVFIRKPDRLNLKLIAENSAYHPRQKVVLDLSARDNDQKPVIGDFSVAVIDETKVPVDEDNESTILSNLLLTSDLSGYVEKPNYYFATQNISLNADLDLLMLTQGYHRFEWRQVLSGQYRQPEFELEKLTDISGKIENLNGKPIPYGKVTMLSVSKLFFVSDTTADANGRFEFRHFPVMDSVRYVIQATGKPERKNTLIEIDKSMPPELKKTKNAPDKYVKMPGDMIAYLNLSNQFHSEELKQGMGKHIIALKEVVIKEKGKQKYLGHSANLNGAGNANHVITADQLPQGCPLLTDCMAGRMGRMHFAKGTPYLIGTLGDMEAAVFIDGVEITVPKTIDGRGQTKADVINTISVSDVASIEIITDASLAAMYGLRGAGGVILITTKRWDDVTSGTRNRKTNYAYYSPVAYYKARVFYSPTYDLPKSNASFADLRTTIYWNPNVVTDKSGNSKLEFFNADTKGTYRVVVEGIDESGNIAREIYKYKVE